jgi:alpha-1,3-rhamnosyl/mannosyltransferase
LGKALQMQGDVQLTPVGFGAYCSAEVFPAAMAGVDLNSYVKRALISAFSPLPWSGESVLQPRIDLFHATDHLVPKFSRIPVVATLMDAIPLSHPQWIRTSMAKQKAWLWCRAGRWANHVITISEYSKQEIVKHFGIDAQRITSIPLGVDDRFFEPIDLSIRTELIARLALPSQFFLFVGTLQPRKNVERVLDAHASLPKALKRDVPLVIIGREGWASERLVARMSDPETGRYVRWLQHLPDVEMRALMQSATALVFPSLCEGFGLPVVEAFASGLPVITSNTTSLPEVAGDSALLVDPQSAGEIAEAMREVVRNETLAQRLRESGLQRARRFTWQACAAGTRGVYEQVLR